jgi:hypothetical protein
MGQNTENHAETKLGTMLLVQISSSDDVQKRACDKLRLGQTEEALLDRVHRQGQTTALKLFEG